MANTTISPNMMMPVPTVSEDPGPDWASNIDASLSIIDSHNHTPGQGVPITPAGININTDLPLNNNNLTTARTVRFEPQGANPGDASDLGCLFEKGVDLYFIDGSGNVIRFTQSGSLAGSTGTITGLPSGTASASFSGTTFTFESATSTPAEFSIGPVTIGQPVVGGFGVTISPDIAQAANYDLTTPLALPSVASSIISDVSGNLSFVPQTDWTAFSPTLNRADYSGTGRYRVIGKQLFIFFTIQYSASGAGATTQQLTVPGGFTIDNVALGNGNGSPIGTSTYTDVANSNVYFGTVGLFSTTQMDFPLTYNITDVTGTRLRLFQTGDGNNGDFLCATISVPVL